MKSRLVHIFTGGSNLGKSYLAALSGKSVYETDTIKCESDLPDTLPHDIIVVGNRWKCDVSLITSRVIQPCEIVHVNFSKEDSL